MYVKVECLCGKILKLNECKSKKCRCGIVISILDDGYFTPIATMPENSLEERIRSGKKVLSAYPVVVEYMDGEEVYLANQLEIIE
jgi:hypothetical protein